MGDNAERVIGEQMQVATNFFSNIDRYIGFACSGNILSAIRLTVRESDLAQHAAISTCVL